MDNKFVIRKNRRLKNYDYGVNGLYFVTICSYGKKQLFSDIVGQGLAPAANNLGQSNLCFAESRLTKYGEIIEGQLLDLERRYNFVRIDKYVIMPNHIHVIIAIEKDLVVAGASPCTTLSDIVCTFKSMSTRICKKEGFEGELFQMSFHDHIIRNDNDYEMIWNYIETNPSKWYDDKYFL